MDVVNATVSARTVLDFTLTVAAVDPTASYGTWVAVAAVPDLAPYTPPRPEELGRS